MDSADQMGSGLIASDGLSLVHWEARKPLTWDATVVCPLADSYVTTSACEACLAAERAAKYTDINTNYIFQHIAVESLEPINASGRDFLFKFGHKLSTQSGDDRDQLFVSTTLRSRSAF